MLKTLSKNGKIVTSNAQKGFPMKFLELNKKRHAVKEFNDKPVDYKDLRTAIVIATLAPSAHNIQPW